MGVKMVRRGRMSMERDACGLLRIYDAASNQDCGEKTTVVKLQIRQCKKKEGNCGCRNFGK